MTKKYRVLAVALAVMMVISLLAACGGTETQTDPTPAAPANTPAANQGTENEATHEVGEVVIGVLAPLTGPVAQFGTAVRDGVNLYVDQFNAQGGLQVQLEWFDEEGQAALGVAGYFDLVDRGATAIIGAVTSGVTMAVVPLAYDDNMPMITGTSTHYNVTVDADTGRVFTNMFRSCFIDPFQGQKMAEFAVEELGAQTAAILYNNEVDYSIGLMQAFTERAEELGLEVVATATFQTGAVDFRGQLTNIAAQNPDVLFVPEYYQSVSLVGPQASGVGLEATLLGADGWATVVDFMDDPSYLNGAYFLTGFSPGVADQGVQDFIAAFQAENGHVPNMFAAQAYDAAMILLAAVELALADGYTPNTDEFKASVIAHMAATDMRGVTGHITFDDKNNPQKTAVILHVVDGEETFWGYF